MEQQLKEQFEQLFNFCLSNERPAELLLLWRRRVESMLKMEDIFYLGVYTFTAYLSYPMNLINQLGFLKIFCYLHLEEKIKKQPYDKNNFALYQKTHPFAIFHIFDMYTFLMGMPPISDEERYNILKSFSLEEKRFLMNNLYTDFSESDFPVNESFEFKVFEAFLATNEEFKDPPVIYSEYEKFKYLCLDCRPFAYRTLATSVLAVAVFFSSGFLVTISAVIFNVVFLQFGLFTDGLLFNHMYSKLRQKESVDSCRRIWRRLQTFMIPLPPGKYVGTLSLCVEEIQGKKHIEFKFGADRYDQTLGQYTLVGSQVEDRIMIKQYPNTGMFFWFNTLSDVKITRRRIKINSYLSVEKFTPEFFLIDFEYFPPYTSNPISKIMCLSALFDLTKITIESHFPGSELTVIDNGFRIKALNTHMRVKISAVARYCLDKMEISNTCNKTNRYQKLKEVVHKDLMDRIEICKKDIESPSEIKAIAPIDLPGQLVRATYKTEVQTITEVKPDPIYNKPVDIPSHLLVLMGHHGLTPTVGWIRPALDFQNRTLNVEHFPKKHWGILRARLAPKVKQNFDHYSGGVDGPLQKETVITKEKIIKIPLGRLIFTEHYPEYFKPRYPGQYPNHVHREISIIPICETLKKLSDPRNHPKDDKKKRFPLAKDKKDESSRAEKKKKRIAKLSDKVMEKEEENLQVIRAAVVEEGKCKEEDADYVSEVVRKLVDRRVRSAGVLYRRIDKVEYNRKVRESKKRFKSANLDPDISYNVGKKLSSILRAKRKEQRKNIRENQANNALNFLSPYVASPSGEVLEADNQFKLFLLKRRLTDYGVAWKKTTGLIYHFGMLRNRLKVTNQNIPNRLRNLMRNILVMSPGPNGDRS